MPLDKIPWKSETIMPWGEHKGTKLDDVPADYLIDLGRKKWLPSAWPGLWAYIRKHNDTLMQQAESSYEQADEEGYSSYEDYIRDIRD